VAQKFQKLLSEIDIDWEEQLSRYTGDIMAYRIGQGLHKTRQWFNNSRQSLSLSGREYLQEEIHLLPTLPEFNQFKQQVSELRDDADRLEALLNHYLQNKNNQ
jgi:ubiquinone biosynthesis protein UbiJ